MAHPGTAAYRAPPRCQPVEVVKDDVCQFGQWLYGPSVPADGASTDYAAVKGLHADFHKCAAKILTCNSGQKAQADALMSGEYAKISTALTGAMMKWKAASH
jgi:hypothetical protein